MFSLAPQTDTAMKILTLFHLLVTAEILQERPLHDLLSVRTFREKLNLFKALFR